MMVRRYCFWLVQCSGVNVYRFGRACFPKTNLSSTGTAKLALAFGRGLENGGFSFGVNETFYRKRSKRQ